jgi:sugar phosphate isomerase/epimerase
MQELVSVQELKDSMLKVYELHSPRHKFFGSNEPECIKKVCALAKSMGLNMMNEFIPDGLNTYENNYPDKAVIFDVRSEDVIMIES